MTPERLLEIEALAEAGKYRSYEVGQLSGACLDLIEEVHRMSAALRGSDAYGAAMERTARTLSDEVDRFSNEVVPALRGRGPGANTTHPCSNLTPRWFSFHWREWHRGHRCDKDDGKPMAPDVQDFLARRRP